MLFKFLLKCILTIRGKQIKKKDRKTLPKTNIQLDLLPSLLPEILFDILLRLPVKTLMKCKFLNKDWLQLITCPGFGRLHLKHAEENKKKILFASSYSGITSLHSLDYENLNEPVFSYDFRLPADLVIVGTSNGLVCLSDYKTMIVICNPATKKYVMKLFDKFHVLPENHQEVFCLGFGYDPVRGEYKVMRVDFSHNYAECELYTETTQVFVYTLGSKSWREVQLPFRLDRGIPILPCVSGAIHVFERIDKCRLKDHQVVSAIILFDIRKEEFRRLSKIPNDYGGVNIGVLQGCLSVTTRKEDGKRSDIWVMKKYDEMKSWTKVYSVSTVVLPNSFVPLAVRKDKVVLLQPWTSKTGILLYDPKSTKVDVHIPAITNWNSADAYVESLLPVSEEKKQASDRTRKIHPSFW